MRVSIVTPVLNDWQCLEHLISELQFLEQLNISLQLFIVDDGSTDSMPTQWDTHGWESIEVLRLDANLGHQRAIAVGLVEVATRSNSDMVVVIDSDGEDDPAHIVKLLECAAAGGGCIAVAKRQQRVASRSFRWLYGGYKALFRAATGRNLDFGNFAVLPIESVNRLCAMPELWNHFPATVMKSRLPIERVPLSRRSRFFGTSRMSTVSLINHGLSGLSVFTDVVFTRMLILSTALAGVLAVVIGGGIVIRLSTNLPIPGWAALTVLAATVALAQIFCALLVVGFLSLSSRASYAPAPRDFASGLIGERISVSQSTEGEQSMEARA